MTNSFVSLAAGLALILSAIQARAEPLNVYQGDGLTIRVLTIADDGTSVTGEIVRGDKTFPFSGELGSDGQTETVMGAFRDGERSFKFTSELLQDGGIIFRTGSKQYRLREVAPGAAPDPKPPIERAPSDTAPVPRKETAAPAGLPDQVKLRLVEFRDVSMANVVAYTMLVPEGWKAEGHIEWSQDRTPYPQRKIKVTASDNSQIAFMPAMTFTYMEATAVGAQGGIIPPRSGEAPPARLGDWIVEKVRQTNRQVSNARLVEDKHDAEADRAMDEMARQTGTPRQGKWETHLITIAYDDASGVPFIEQINATIAVLDPMPTANMVTQSWMLFVNSQIKAPAAKFEALRPLMHASANSLRPVPKWWTQQQIILMEITAKNHQVGMDEIARRGRFYDQMSDAQFAAWKKSQAPGDRAQRQRINTIYEVSTFPGPDGTGVNLPIHYKSYFTDGKGNYLMSQSASANPGGEWKPIQPLD